MDPGAEIAALSGPRAVIDAIVRDAVYAQKALARWKRWEAVAAVERIRW